MSNNYLSNSINYARSCLSNYEHTFDFTTRLDQVVEFTAEEEQIFQRCAQAALPILSFYQPLRTPAVLCSSGLQILSLCKTGEKDNTKIMIQAAGLVMALYASTNYPRLAPVVTLAYQLYSNSDKIFAGDRAAIFKVICTLTYISSLYFRISELTVASMLMQAGKELYDSNNEFENKRHIEGFAKVALAFLRLIQFKDEMGGLYQKYSGEETTQSKSDTPENTGPENTQENKNSSSGELSEGENLKPPTQEIQLENPSVSEDADSKDLTEGNESEILSEDTQQQEAPSLVEETKIENPIEDTQLKENSLSEGCELETSPQGDSEELKLNDSLSEELS